MPSKDMKVLLITSSNPSYSELLSCLNDIAGCKFESLRDAVKCLVKKGYILYSIPLLVTANDLKVVEGSKLRVVIAERGVDRKLLEEISEFVEGELIYPIKVERVFNCVVVGRVEDRDCVAVLETKVDDVSGEVMSYAIERVLEKALDVEVIPAFGKKNRPCFLIRAIATLNAANEVAEVMMRETGSIGVRIIPLLRVKSSRCVKEIKIKISDRIYNVRVKVSGVNFKPEFEDVKRIAENERLSIVEAYRLVYSQIG